MPSSSTLTLLCLASSTLASALAAGLSKPDSKVARNVLEGKAEGYCSPSGPIESTHCLYETVESLNAKLYPSLQSLVTYPFFKHYKVDLFRECPFWYENGFCMNRNCGVETADESEIPEKWRARALSEINASPQDSISSCYFREQDFCYIEDDANQDGQYVDLSLNPERFTGYAGHSAHQVWKTIYEENCFGLSEASLEAGESGTSGVASALLGAGLGSGSGSGPGSGSGQGSGSGSQGSGFGAAPSGFSKLSQGWGTEMIKSAQGDSEMCEEKKVYYRVISGLHASISIHICHEYLDQQTGEWAPNLDCFIARLASHPERLSNVYFNAVLLLRAVDRAAPYLEAYDIGVAPSGRQVDERGTKLRESDRKAKANLKEVLKMAKAEGMEKGFDEGDFFTGPDAVILKEQFKTHFRNVSRIMDCVGCDKCRLWGKLQVSGLGTALKILFELDDKTLDPKINPDLLQRSEVVALFNTLHRVSESLSAVENFRKMYAATQAAEVETSRAKVSQRIQEQLDARNASRSWSISTIAGLILSAFETLRRGCRGCVEVCLAQLEGGYLGDLGRLLRDWIGGGGGKVDRSVEL